MLKKRSGCHRKPRPSVKPMIYSLSGALFADPVSCILELKPNNPATASSLVQFVVISAVRVSVLPSSET